MIQSCQQIVLLCHSCKCPELSLLSFSLTISYDMVGFYEKARLPVRGAALVLAIIILGLSADGLFHGLRWRNPILTLAVDYQFRHTFYQAGSSYIYYYTIPVPSSISFVIFSSVWTIFVLAYLLLAPKLAPKYVNPTATLILDALIMVFWFAGFIAVAAYMRTPFDCDPACGASNASIVFAAFEWYVEGCVSKARDADVASRVLFLIATVFESKAMYENNRVGSHWQPQSVQMEVSPRI
jgi:hypothetical protein